ncbi:TolC family protein, partial [Serratia rubidaea]|uniref:TolC family protein n=1 Tax=Serratia rubidaea TaxID=61652 RepID=UPI001BAEA278
MTQNKLLQRLAVVSLPWLLAGCLSLDPDYQRPALPVTLGDSAAASQTAGYPQVAWRDYITDPRLRQVVALSLDANRDLREAIANIAAARAQYAQSRASLLPTLDAGLDGSRSRALSGSGNATAISQSYQAQASTSAFELDLFGKNRSQTRAQYESYLSSAEAARSTRLSVIATVVEAWITLAADRSNLAAAQDTMVSAQRSLAVTRNNQRHGIVSLVDVASADTVYQAARADVAEYATLVAQDNNALVLAVGQPV